MALGAGSPTCWKRNTVFSVATATCSVWAETLTILGFSDNFAGEICPVSRSQNRISLFAKAIIKIRPSGDQLMLRMFFLSGCCLKYRAVWGCQHTICPVFEPAASHSPFSDQRSVVN